MTPHTMDRLTRLEADAVPPSTGKHLVFRVEAPSGTSTGEIIAFLKGRGHAIHEGDDVFVMNLAAHGMTEGEAPRDLSPILLTEEERTKIGGWPVAEDLRSVHVPLRSTDEPAMSQ